MRIYTIFNKLTGKYWEGIDDMNSCEKWATGFTFWFDHKLAMECLAYHKDSSIYNKYGDYDDSYVVELEIKNVFTIQD